MSLQSNCSMYFIEAHCGRTSQSPINDCAWISSKCCSMEMINNGQCCPATVIDISYGNTNINCESKSVTDNSLTWTQCQEFDISCSVNQEKSSCFTKFYPEKSCITSDSQSICAIWKVAPLNLCQQIIYPSDCELYTSQPGDLIHSDCQYCNPLCTSTADGSGCQEYVNLCSEYTQSDLCSQAKEGTCQWSNNSCIKSSNRLLTILSSSTDQFSQLKQIITTSCKFYSNKTSCSFNQYGEKCFWSPSNEQCVELSCENIEKTTLFNTHEKCNIVDPNLLCTVRQSHKGCQRRTSCSLYTLQEQCHLNDVGQPCIWNLNLEKPLCQDKQCSTAPQYEYYTHYDCLNYQPICTVAVQKKGKSLIYLGCQNLTDCSLYIAEEQCKINQQGNKCEWKNHKCDVQTCLTASDNLSTDSECKQYHSSCTISQSGNGCVETPISCELIENKQQCIQDKYGKQCIWLLNNCITKTCEHINDNESDCHSFSSQCIYSDNNCQTQICEDYNFKTDSLCKAAMHSCTTDGKRCILRGTCKEAQSKAGCVLSINNEECEWLDKLGYCTNKTCDTAPITLQNETLCSQYFPNCTTKLGGGCIKKSTCYNVFVEEACTTDIQGTICYWDNNICINKSDINNKPCHQFTQDNCIFSNTEGPCLWINDKINQINSCYAYSSCTSIQWTTDKQCKQISKNCTTNGINCIAITSCAQTIQKEACVSGYDGQCYMDNNSQCQKFTSCSSINYSNHQDCQAANPLCTTNGNGTCQELTECNQYSVSNCYISSKGKEQTASGILQTGICVWDEEYHYCRQQQCDDLEGITHDICNNQLVNCTSNGQKCISISLCEKYSPQIECQTAKGSDGICIWKKSCHKKSCADIENQFNPLNCEQANLNCISDGIQCITKDKCPTYKTEQACRNNGTNGICIYSAQSGCSLMISCESANLDKQACSQANDRCQWVNNKCQDHTCQSYYGQNLICVNFYNWNDTNLIYCKLDNQRCTNISPSSLSSQDCYFYSNNTYYWDDSNSSCSSCSKVTSEVSNPKPIGNTGQYILQFKILFFIFIGY